MILLLASTAWPCAGLVHDPLATAESDAAEVVFEVGPGDVAVTYKVVYDGDAEDFGWVIPVPAEILQVADGDPSLFGELHDLTDPLVAVLDDGEGGGGCGCGGAAKGGLEGARNDVEVVAQGFTGTYDWTALRADEADALSDWFTDNGWDPLPAEDLDHYVGLDSWFLAVTVSPDRAETPGEGRELPPLLVRYAGDALRFPSVMARGAVVPEQRTTVWVVADSSAVATEGWTHTDVTSLSGGAGDDPAALFDAELAGLGAERGWARIFAGDTMLGHVTRFDTRAPSAVHDADAVFGIEETPAELSLEITLGGGGGTTALLLPLVGLVTWRRRRS